jgi:hypothetical protein
LLSDDKAWFSIVLYAFLITLACWAFLDDVAGVEPANARYEITATIKAAPPTKRETEEEEESMLQNPCDAAFITLSLSDKFSEVISVE